jgi:hypothetical protein
MVLEERLAEISGRTTRVSLPLFLLILFFIGIAYSLVLVLPATQLKAYAREDGLIENAGAIFYLLAAVTMIVTFLRRSSGRFYFLLLAIFFSRLLRRRDHLGAANNRLGHAQGVEGDECPARNQHSQFVAL